MKMLNLLLCRATSEYMDGARNFVKVVEQNEGHPKKILCLCLNYVNLSHQYVDDVYEHLVKKGMDPTCRIWVHHGEQPIEIQMEGGFDLGDVYNVYMAGDIDIGTSKGSDEEFKRNLDDVLTPLYEG